MSIRFRNTVMLAVLATCSALATAQTEASSRVGRISMTQGQVSIGGEIGDESDSAVVNWPVTSRNQITTGRDSRTEIRIGSTAIRLDADSALEVTELDDNNLRLHLQYGSASVRVRSADAARGFELSTPQGIVRMQEPGRMRIDAGRRQDTTSVTVFDGIALIDGGGSRLTVRQGKRAELGMDDIRTGVALRDGFDDWAMLRDERDDRSESVRYVSREMTGYEDLDQHGSWHDSSEYGPLWSPRRVSLGWAPYRDGRWTYLQPWGWTWVDNAPWGYAPFHYGRWVMVNNRWSWAPGRNISRAIWSPALVGWVGGSNWNLSFNHRGTRRAAPAQGWYPLAPRDAYVPTYRISHDHLRDVNRYAGTVGQDVKGHYRRSANHRHLTVVPQEHFNRRGSISVRNAAQPVVSPSALADAPAALPPSPVMAQRERRNELRGDGRADIRGDIRGDDRVRVERGGGGVANNAVTQAVEAARRNNQVPVIGNAQLTPSAVVPDRDGRFNNDGARRQRTDRPDSNVGASGSLVGRAQADAVARAQADAQAQAQQQQQQFRQQQAEAQAQLQAQQAQAQVRQAQEQQARFQAEQAQAMAQAQQIEARNRSRAQFQEEARGEMERERRRGTETYQQRPQFQQQPVQPMQQVQQVQQVQQAPRQQEQVSFARPAPSAPIQQVSPPPPRQNDEQREQRRQMRQEAEDKR